MDKIGIEDLKMKSCKICGKLSDEDICKYCLAEYQPKISRFIREYPGITYAEAVFSKDLPVPRNVLYEFSNAGIIKIK